MYCVSPLSGCSCTLSASSGNFALSAAIALVATLSNRLIWTRFIDLDQFRRRILVLGSGATAATVSNKMRRKADRRGFRIVGIYKAKLASLEEMYVYAGRDTLQKMLNIEGQVSEIVATGDDYRYVDSWLIRRLKS